MGKLKDAIRQIEKIREKSSECILMQSLGKDSLVLLDLLYPRFERVVCVFMYFVKDLEHINRWVRYVKVRYPKIEFVQIPHWNLTYVLRSGMYCVAQPKIRLLNLADVVRALRDKYHIDYVFTGMKKADSLNRRVMMTDIIKKRLAKGEEELYESKGMCYPLADLTQKDILIYMRDHHLPEPVRYSKDASGGLGFNIQCFTWMEKNFPQDLERIYKVFPLSRRILMEHHLKEEKEQDKTIDLCREEQD